MLRTDHFVCLHLAVGSLVLLNLLGFVIQVGCLHFTYPNFPKEGEADFITTDHSQIVEKALQVTTDANGILISNLSGRVLYKHKFKLWNRRKTASFNSSFVLNIKPMTEPNGEGLAFILSGDPDVPMNSQGQWLGIVNASTNGFSQNQIVAVEFDTRKSYPQDLDDNHIGIDVNSIYSIKQVSLSNYGINLSSGTNLTCNIRYDGKSNGMVVDVSMDNGTTANVPNPSISLQLDLSGHLPEDVYVGFSASTGHYTQLNCIRSWNFAGEDIDKGSLLWIWIMIPVITVLCVGLAARYLYWRRKLRQQSEVVDKDIEAEIGNSTGAPRKFLLKELKFATANFDPKNKLGQGGFGTVYKGFLKDIDKEVAIKKVSKDSHQGMKEFIAEVTTISRLRHKNLVKLIGWCRKRDDLLLVYEFLPHGSLDKHLFSNECSTVHVHLSWEKRQKIICGVASALSYLHNGCEKRVLHRDVKSSNVMLDSDYNAQLGDFGLARTIHGDGQTHHSTNVVAGTPGYIAPECFHTGRASVESDVYGFGVFTLEVASGRRPSNYLQDHRITINDDCHNHNQNIIDWVWDLYRRLRVLEAADHQLHGEFNEEQMEGALILGLACCHPNPNERPSMTKALQVLTGEAPPPLLPNAKPAFIWPAVTTFSEDSIWVEEPCSTGGQQTPSTDLSGR